MKSSTINKKEDEEYVGRDVCSSLIVNASMFEFCCTVKMRNKFIMLLYLLKTPNDPSVTGKMCTRTNA